MDQNKDKCICGAEAVQECKDESKSADYYYSDLKQAKNEIASLKSKNREVNKVRDELEGMFQKHLREKDEEIARLNSALDRSCKELAKCSEWNHKHSEEVERLKVRENALEERLDYQIEQGSKPFLDLQDRHMETKAKVRELEEIIKNGWLPDAQETLSKLDKKCKVRLCDIEYILKYATHIIEALNSEDDDD